MTAPVPPQATENRQAEPRERGLRTWIVVTVVCAVVVLVGTAASVWFFSGRGGQSNQHVAPPTVSMPTHTVKPKPTPDNAAYTVGTCLSEPTDPNSGGLEIKPVPCAGQLAVLVINQVVHNYPDCQQGADYVNHGFILSDEFAGVDYCASLVVPANQCFAFSTDNSKPIQRAELRLGAERGPGRVGGERRDAVTDACKDQTTPDIWYFQSPSSGQFACVSPLPPDRHRAAARRRRNRRRPAGCRPNSAYRGSSRSLPVVRLPSRSSCALAASASG